MDTSLCGFSYYGRKTNVSRCAVVLQQCFSDFVEGHGGQKERIPNLLRNLQFMRFAPRVIRNDLETQPVIAGPVDEVEVEGSDLHFCWENL